VLLHGGVELARQSVSANAPLVQITSPNTAVAWTAGTTETLTWQAADPDAGDVLTYSVFYSHDRDPSNRRASFFEQFLDGVDVDALAGGAEARFRVVASDGVNIGEDQTDFPINVPDKAPQALILNPTDQAQVLPGDLLVLQGSGNDFEDGTLPDLALAWSSDRQGPLGTGVSLPVNNLQPGLHKITLSATDSSGQTSQTTVEVFIGAKLHLPIVLR